MHGSLTPFNPFKHPFPHFSFLLTCNSHCTLHFPPINMHLGATLWKIYIYNVVQLHSLCIYWDFFFFFFEVSSACNLLFWSGDKYSTWSCKYTRVKVLGGNRRRMTGIWSGLATVHWQVWPIDLIYGINIQRINYGFLFLNTGQIKSNFDPINCYDNK